ncbi:hypothetical protein BGX38DRAFT_1172234 [Terfezia claveryi]|nr:hypothetical protein BGX38DRAFT_1172234 [Terfezia claveryi]
MRCSFISALARPSAVLYFLVFLFFFFKPISQTQTHACIPALVPMAACRTIIGRSELGRNPAIFKKAATLLEFLHQLDFPPCDVIYLDSF